MIEVRKMVVMLLMVFGAISVSFGYDLTQKQEENYQKLKAEMEEVEQSDWMNLTCSWDEEGEAIIEGRGSGQSFAKDWCGLKNVLAFVDEYRKFDKKELEKELKKFNKNARVWGDDVYNKVKQMDRFKNDVYSGIYSCRDLSQLLEKALEKWKETKLRRSMLN